MEVLRRVRALRRRREKSLVEDTLDLHLPSSSSPSAVSSIASAASRHLFPANGLGGGGVIDRGRSQSVSLLSCEDLNSLSSAELGLIFRDALFTIVTFCFSLHRNETLPILTFKRLLVHFRHFLSSF